jgi:hypothetical protein
MRVKQVEIGNRTYKLKNDLELPPGTYDLFADGSDVCFVPVNHLLERSEHA